MVHTSQYLHWQTQTHSIPPILTRHFYDMSNMMSRNEGVLLSNGWVKTLLWIFIPSIIYTIASVVYLICHL